MESRAPSGLFPAGPPRPTFREPHQVRVGAALAGAGGAAAWLLVFGLLASSVRTYFWWTMLASAAATAAAFALAKFGDRGAAVGVAITTGLGVSIAVTLTVERWITTGWPL